MPELDIEQIKKALPHRYPMLLLDRVVDYTPGESLTAIKNVTINEPFFQGHFPQRPIMPGVLIIEAMAQATAVLGLCPRRGAGTGTSCITWSALTRPGSGKRSGRAINWCLK